MESVEPVIAKAVANREAVLNPVDAIGAQLAAFGEADLSALATLEVTHLAALKIAILAALKVPDLPVLKALRVHRATVGAALDPFNLGPAASLVKRREALRLPALEARAGRAAFDATRLEAFAARRALNLHALTAAAIFGASGFSAAAIFGAGGLAVTALVLN